LKMFKLQKKGNIGVGTIISSILVLVFLSVLLSVLTSTIPTAASAYHTLAQSFAGNTTIYGSEASAFATQSMSYMGWFWVVGAFVMVVLLVLGVFGLNRR